MNPGKRFEERFRRSLAARGYVRRIQDKTFRAQGGVLLSRPSEGDFWHFSKDGHGYLVECKATKAKSFPFSKLRPEQEAELAAFDSVAANFHGVVALNFYADDLRERDRCFVVTIGRYLRYRSECGRASMPLSDAEAVCVECPKRRGIYDVRLETLCR